MASIINATTTNGVAISADNSGILQLATNSGTTALTLSVAQAATFVSSVTATSLTAPILSSATTLSLQTNGTTTAVTIDASGNVLVNTTSAIAVGQYSASFDGTVKRGATYTGSTTFASSNYITFFTQSTQVGTIVGNGVGGVLYSTTSDYRLKENISPIATGLSTILALNPVTFDWIATKGNDSGFIAHEFQSIIPNSVSGLKDALDNEGNPEYQAIDSSGAIPFLVASIQELKAIIDLQQTQITALNAKVGI